jgi:flagellar motor switch protein FliN/FliY
VTSTPARAPLTTSPAHAAAAAAADVLPLGGPVEPVQVPVEELELLPGTHTAVLARFSGAQDGTVAVLLSGADLLALSGGETVDAECCRPAVEAAATALGPCTLAELRTVSAPELLALLRAAGDEASLARLGDDPTDAVHLAVMTLPPAPTPRTVGTDPADDLPAPRRAPVAGALADGGSRRVEEPGPERGADRGMGLLRGVQMEVTAEIGRTRLTVQELLELAAGSVVELDRPIGSPADLLVNGRLFARGEVVVVDEDFAIRITEILDPDRDV